MIKSGYFEYTCPFCDEKLCCSNERNGTESECPNCKNKIVPSKIKKVFICSPYRGNVELNLQNVKKYCKLAIEEGCLPIAPHLYFPLFLNDENENERNTGIKFGEELLKECDEVWIFGDLTEGMKQEVELAKKLGKEIIFK